MVAWMVASQGRDGGCALGVDESGGKVIQRGGGHALGVGKLCGVTQNDGGGLVVAGLSGVIQGEVVVGATGQSVAEIVVGQATSEGGDRGEVAQ